MAVVGVGGSGTLTGVKNLGSGGETYCAVLFTGGVDCWGEGAAGELGNGIYYTTDNEGVRRQSRSKVSVGPGHSPL